MNGRNVVCGVGGLFGVGACSLDSAGAPPNAVAIYNVIDLGTLGGSNSQAFAINTAGQIVGYAYITTGDAVSHAASWANSGSSAVDLGTLGGHFSHAKGINDSGQIVGDANITGDTAQHAVF